MSCARIERKNAFRIYRAAIVYRQLYYGTRGPESIWHLSRISAGATSDETEMLHQLPHILRPRCIIFRCIRCHLITTSMRRRADTVYIYNASSRSKFKTLRKLREKGRRIFGKKSEYGHSCDISIVESRIDVIRWTGCVQLPTGPGR